MQPYEEILDLYQSTKKEQNIISNIYESSSRSAKIIYDCIDSGLEPMHFHNIDYARLYEQAIDRTLNSESVSLLDLPDNLLGLEVVDYHTVPQDCRDIIELYEQRQILNGVYRSASYLESQEPNKALDELVATIESKPAKKKKLSDISLDDVYNVPLQDNATPFYISKFDKIKLFLLKGHIYSVGADTGAGKTTFTVNLMAKQISKGNNVLMFSLEQPMHEIYMRLLTILSGYSEYDITTGRADRDVLEKVDVAIKRYTHIIDDSLISTQSMTMQAKIIHQRTPLSMIVVDLWQLINNKGNSYLDRLVSSADGLLAMAKQLSVPVIAIAQVDKASSRMGKLDRNAFSGSKQLSNNSSYVFMLQKNDSDGVELEVVKSRKPGHAGVVIQLPINPTNERLLI